MTVRQLIKILEEFDGNLKIKFISKTEEQNYDGSFDIVSRELDIKYENIKLPEEEGDYDPRVLMDLRFYLESLWCKKIMIL